MASFFKKLFGSDKPRVTNVDNLQGNQQELLNFLIQNIMQGQGGFGFDEDYFQQNFVDPQLRTFENQIAPGIQQKFIKSGLGRSSSAEDALARAGINLQDQLSGQRAELLNNALNRQLQGAQTALGTKAQTPVVSQQPGILGSFLSSFGQSAGPALSRRFFGPQDQYQQRNTFR